MEVGWDVVVSLHGFIQFVWYAVTIPSWSILYEP